MTTMRKQYSPKFKAKVAAEAIRGERTLSQLASQYQVHPMQVGQWRKTALEQMVELFVDGRKRRRRGEETEKEALYEQIGRLKVELDWLKKKWSESGRLWPDGDGRLSRKVPPPSRRAAALSPRTT
jgi:transposase-like protein